MRERWKNLASIMSILAVPSLSLGDTLDQNQKALDLITDTAGKLCTMVRDSGELSSSKINGEINGQLNGLAAKLVSLGFKGGGEVANESFKGLVRGDLPTAIAKVDECRLRVFDKLEAKLIK